MFGLSRISKILLGIISVAVLLWIHTVRRLSRHIAATTSLSPSNLLLSSTTTRLQDCSTSSSSSSTTTTLQYRHRRNEIVKESDLPQVLAIYFPQFHPDPLNDRLWQVNFTDWISLKAAPTHNRLGIRIPRPADGIYYDLRNTAVRQRQGALARHFGVDGYVMHHYWFYDPIHPGPNLHAPLERMLQDGQPDLPFLFNWCASTWTSLWTGKAAGQTQAGTRNNPVVLQEQYWNATTQQIRQHYQWLRQFWILPNYIRVNQQPVLMIYQYFPQMKPILQQLRRWAVQDEQVGGLVIWMSRSATHPDLYDISALDENTQRIWKRRSQQTELLPTTASRHDGFIFNATVAYPYPHPWVSQPLQIPAWCFNHDMMNDDPSLGALGEIPGVVTSFDNTPRRQADKAVLWNVEKDPKVAIQRFADSMYAAMYYETCCRPQTKSAQASRFVMINAWNEWAEAMALEPSDVYGTGFLQAIRDTKDKILQEGCK